MAALTAEADASCRAALPSLQRAVKDWKRQNVDFAMHFGTPYTRNTALMWGLNETV